MFVFKQSAQQTRQLANTFHHKNSESKQFMLKQPRTIECVARYFS
jgi:hypothetical protein